jgi:hypothetical protein
MFTFFILRPVVTTVAVAQEHVPEEYSVMYCCTNDICAENLQSQILNMINIGEQRFLQIINLLPCELMQYLDCNELSIGVQHYGDTTPQLVIISQDGTILPICDYFAANLIDFDLYYAENYLAATTCHFDYCIVLKSSILAFQECKYLMPASNCPANPNWPCDPIVVVSRINFFDRNLPNRCYDLVTRFYYACNFCRQVGRTVEYRTFGPSHSMAFFQQQFIQHGAAASHPMWCQMTTTTGQRCTSCNFTSTSSRNTTQIWCANPNYQPMGTEPCYNKFIQDCCAN